MFPDTVRDHMDDRNLEAEKWREAEHVYVPVCWPEVDLKSLS